MSYTNGGIFHEGGESMPSPIVAARSQYPSRFHGSTFFQPQSVPVYRENPMYVPGLGADAAPQPGCGCGGFKSMTGTGASPDGIGWYDINRADSFGGALSGSSAAGTAVQMGLVGAVSGAFSGALVGVVIAAIAKKDLQKSAMYGAGIGGGLWALYSAYAGYKVASAFDKVSAR